MSVCGCGVNLLESRDYSALRPGSVCNLDGK
jgi:hypothetical protein